MQVFNFPESLRNGIHFGIHVVLIESLPRIITDSIRVIRGKKVWKFFDIIYLNGQTTFYVDPFSREYF